MPNQLILDRYRVIDQAGSGGFATVFVAWDTKLQRKVAIKHLRLSELDAYRVNAPARGAAVAPWEEDPSQGLDDIDFPADPAFLGGFAASVPAEDPDVRLGDVAQERFLSHIPGLDEARAAAFLNDTNIVQTYDFQTMGNQAYIIMEYVEGMTLTDFMKQFDSELTLDIIASIFADVVHALEAAHENQVLHLDIKPDNIMINRKGVVKVTDFGLAALFDLDGNAYTHGGTIGYMPIEQMRQESLDARCDEWALASVTYQLLAGENPFFASDLDKAEQAISSAELVLPSLMWEDLDEQADDVLFYALDPDRDERYDNVTDFAEELQPLLGDPSRGRKELAALVNHAPATDDKPARRALPERVPLCERLSYEVLGVIGRVLSAVAAFGLVFLALMNVPQSSQVGAIAMLVVAAASAGLGAFRPGWGAGVVGVAWGIALLLNQQYLLGAVLVVATLVWWFSVGRFGYAAGGVALLHPFAGIAHIPMVGPLVAGCTLPPGKAIATTLYCVALSFVLGCVGFGNMMYFDAFRASHFLGASTAPADLALQLASVPGTWVIAASWVVAALTFSLLCRSGRRVPMIAGAVLAFVIFVAGLMGAQGVNTLLTSFAPDMSQVFLAAVSCIAVTAFRLFIPSDEEF